MKLFSSGNGDGEKPSAGFSKNIGGRVSDFFKNKIARRIAIAAGAAVLAVIAAVVAYSIWETPPSIADTQSVSDTAQASPDGSEGDAFEGAITTGRNDGIYTFLLIGSDNGFGNTDTIMVGRLDTNEHTMDFVSIPRDTLVNIGWSIKKINAVYSGTINSGGVGIEGLKKHIKNICGFEIDCYAVIDINAFVEIVDEIGGIEFNVPVNMDYDDPAQDFHVHLEAGLQTLDGEQALGVVRFRQNNNGSGYANADLGRIETQQAFLKTVAKQLLTLGNIPNLPRIIEIITKNLDTDLSAANVSFIMRQFLLCDSEDINFHTAPTTGATIYGISYVSLDIESWLEMVNEYLNPYSEPVTTANVNILTSNSSGTSFFSTTGEYAGGYGSFSNYSPTVSTESVSETEAVTQAAEAPEAVGIYTGENGEIIVVEYPDAVPNTDAKAPEGGPLGTEAVNEGGVPAEPTGEYGINN